VNNINSQLYWETRSSTGDWEEKKNRWQTTMFAKGINKLYIILRDNTLKHCGFGISIKP